MARPAINFDTVRELAGALDGVKASAEGRAPALRVRGKLLAWVPLDRSAEPDSLAVSIALDRRAELLASDPDVYYVTRHYLAYPTVLVRLPRIRTGALKDLLATAWAFVTAEARARERASR